MNLQLLIEQTLVDLKLDLVSAKGNVAAYMNQRLLHIATLAETNEPGIEASMRVELRNMALFAAIDIERVGDLRSAKFIGLATGLLRLAAAGVIR
jgi:hypothetical protein